METEPFTWVDAQEHEDKSRMGKSNELKDSRGADKWNELNILNRLEELKKKVSSLRQEISIERDERYCCLIQRVEDIEDVVESLFRKKQSTRDEACIQRETVLNTWSGGPSSTTEHGSNGTTYEGDIRADIRAINAKEENDPETAERWKTVFLDRYSVQWGVDCGRGNELSHVPLEMIRVFNIRARVIHGWGKTRGQILDICDYWIGRWRSGEVTYIPSKDYRQLCRLYYA
ncbi:hypothetical protein VN97_g5451 [Penicillium thymicola]|uniref:Uncharacterized protein n=1 Tax=Penicillium thymicola TaxID=293382 RepID=A0AAI9X973_PENTH|nr:hypothetical protein VN97_g5451 [Penicillium thymicola]